MTERLNVLRYCRQCPLAKSTVTFLCVACQSFLRGVTNPPLLSSLFSNSALCLMNLFLFEEELVADACQERHIGLLSNEFSRRATLRSWWRMVGFPVVQSRPASLTTATIPSHTHLLEPAALVSPVASWITNSELGNTWWFWEWSLEKAGFGDKRDLSVVSTLQISYFL